MDQIKQTALNQAVRLLNAVGQPYAILLEDGSQLGSLEIVKPKPGRNKTERVVQWHWVREFPNYLQQVRAMQPGDVLEFDASAPEVPPDGDWQSHIKQRRESLRGSIVSSAIRAFGEGSCMSTLIGDTGKVQILRVN